MHLYISRGRFDTTRRLNSFLALFIICTFVLFRSASGKAFLISTHFRPNRDKPSSKADVSSEVQSLKFLGLFAEDDVLVSSFDDSRERLLPRLENVSGKSLLFPACSPRPSLACPLSAPNALLSSSRPVISSRASSNISFSDSVSNSSKASSKMSLSESDWLCGPCDMVDSMPVKIWRKVCCHCCRTCIFGTSCSHSSKVRHPRICTKTDVSRRKIREIKRQIILQQTLLRRDKASSSSKWALSRLASIPYASKFSGEGFFNQVKDLDFIVFHRLAKIVDPRQEVSRDNIQINVENFSCVWQAYRQNVAEKVFQRWLDRKVSPNAKSKNCQIELPDTVHCSCCYMRQT